MRLNELFKKGFDEYLSENGVSPEDLDLYKKTVGNIRRTQFRRKQSCDPNIKPAARDVNLLRKLHQKSPNIARVNITTLRAIREMRDVVKLENKKKE